MITEWLFEPCSPEDKPWLHAVKGTSPHGAYVIGYGDTPALADADARRKAQGGTFTTTGPCTLLVGDGLPQLKIVILSQGVKPLVDCDEWKPQAAERAAIILDNDTGEELLRGLLATMQVRIMPVRTSLEDTTATLTAQSEALIRLAGVPFADF